jgi:hypothetical protein
MKMIDIFVLPLL